MKTFIFGLLTNQYFTTLLGTVIGYIVSEHKPNDDNSKLTESYIDAFQLEIQQSNNRADSAVSRSDRLSKELDSMRVELDKSRHENQEMEDKNKKLIEQLEQLNAHRG